MQCKLSPGAYAREMCKDHDGEKTPCSCRHYSSSVEPLAVKFSKPG